MPIIMKTVSKIVCRVEKNDCGVNVWKIIENTDLPSAVGLPTMYGVPSLHFNDYPEGTTQTVTLKVPVNKPMFKQDMYKKK